MIEKTDRIIRATHTQEDANIFFDIQKTDIGCQKLNRMIAGDRADADKMLSLIADPIPHGNAL